MFLAFVSYWLAIVGQTPTGAGGPIDNTAVIVAAVSVIGTLSASWFMFRGKTQDTANWLITELRNEAKLARKTAQECGIRQSENRIIIDDLRSLVAGLQSGLRRLNRENNELKFELRSLKEEITAEIEYTHALSEGPE